MAIRVKPEYKKLVDLFQSLTGKRSMWQVYNDVITMIACSIQNQFSHLKKYDNIEKQYIDIAKQYESKELGIIVNIFAEIINMLDVNPYQDLLGDLYMQLDIGSNALGQFFTPYHLAQLMAQSEVYSDKVNKEIAEKGYITVSEPACGGGANVIAFCEVLHNKGIDYQNKCVIVCQDLSRLTALMCYIVLSLIGCSAVVKIGDTLNSPFTTYMTELKKGAELWTTPMFHINGCYNKI